MDKHQTIQQLLEIHKNMETNREAVSVKKKIKKMVKYLQKYKNNDNINKLLLEEIERDMAKLPKKEKV